MVHPSNVNRVKNYVKAIEAEQIGSPRPWREVIQGLRPNESLESGILRGARDKAELTQARLSELTGIPQRHISEMERGKRPIGKESARKLAAALNTDYRVFL
ncbi:MAG: helix-turn-helix transcriptional regulator [Geobacteraceae bacterium]|nr:helix-turn-helix transcriptional regulator [Geobacteraceae bacterium]